MKDRSEALAFAIVGGELGRTLDPDRPVYLADNSRYRPDAHLIRERVEALCRQHALRALWPFAHAAFPTGTPLWQRRVVGMAEENALEHVKFLRFGAQFDVGENAHAIIAELSPFRGPHLNPVVAFEIGLAVARQCPVFGWTTAFAPATPGPIGPPSLLSLRDRVHAGCRPAPDGYWRDSKGNRVENFELVEEAVIAGNLVSLSASIEDAIRVCADYFAARPRAVAI